MALTTTEENQLRELLRRMNATRSGRTASQLSIVGNTDADFVIASKNDVLSRVGPAELGIRMVRSNVGTDGTNLTTASTTYNHLMTRDATRSEINRLTRSDIDTAAQLGRTAQASANANTTAIDGLRSDHNGRLTGLESWRRTFVDPGLERRVGVIGNVYSRNPVMQVGVMNPAGADLANRTHRFPVPMARDPVIFFSLQGDVSYPRHEFLIEGGKVTGFVLFHSPTSGRWMAIGTQA